MELYKARRSLDDHPLHELWRTHEQGRDAWLRQVISDYCDTTQDLDQWVASHVGRISGIALDPASDVFARPQPVAYDDRSIRWVAAHTKELYALYPDQWILVEGEAVVGSSENPHDLMAIAKQRGTKAAFITRATRPAQPQRMIYAE